MLELFKLFPPYLTLLTVILVIIPTTIAILLRISLYIYLKDLVSKVTRLLTVDQAHGLKPSIVKKLEERFTRASIQLEQVNTLAIIEATYNSQEKFSFIGLSLRCEQWNYFCQILPNLLLAFGLLGTFLGITLNLYDMSQTITQVDAGDITSLVGKLQLPLQSMGIAFITSLIALLSSSLLSIVNTRCNTNLAKSILINSLEDYLDNILQTKIEGHSRLDKAVNRMVEQQNEFLTRFHEKIGQVLETTIGQAANRMVEANKKFHEVATQVGERWLESSSVMAKTAENFQHSVALLEHQVQHINNIVPNFQEHSDKLAKGASLFLEASEKINQSKFSENVEKHTANLANTQAQFSKSTVLLGQNIIQIIESNKKATELAESFYTQMQEASNKLEKSATGFLEASEKFVQCDFADKLSNANLDLSVTYNQFAASAASLNQSTQLIESALDKMQESVDKIVTVSQDINSLTQTSSRILSYTEKRLSNEEKGLNNIKLEISKLIETFHQNQAQINVGMEMLSKNLSTNVELQLAGSKQQIEGIVNRVGDHVNKLGEVKSELINLAKVIIENNKTNQEQMNLGFELLSDKLITNVDKQLASSKQQSEIIVTRIGDHVNKLGDVKLELVNIAKVLVENQAKTNGELRSLKDGLIATINTEIGGYKQVLDKVQQSFTNFFQGNRNKDDINELNKRLRDL